MIRLLILALLFFLAYTLVTALIRSLGSRGKELPREKTTRGEDMVQDPQCGTYIPRGDALVKNVRGERHHFCSEECHRAFADRE